MNRIAEPPAPPETGTETLPRRTELFQQAGFFNVQIERETFFVERPSGRSSGEPTPPLPVRLVELRLFLRVTLRACNVRVATELHRLSVKPLRIRPKLSMECSQTSQLAAPPPNQTRPSTGRCSWSWPRSFLRSARALPE